MVAIRRVRAAAYRKTTCGLFVQIVAGQRRRELPALPTTCRMISSDAEDSGVAIVGFSFRAPQSSVTHPRHGSTSLDSRKPQAGRESNLRGTVVAFESGPQSAVAVRAHSDAGTRRRAKRCRSNTELTLESPGEVALIGEPGC